MKFPPVKALLFDFGGVLININYHATIDAFKAMGIEDFDALYSQANQSSLFDDIETGKISSQRFINGLLDFLPPGTSPNRVVAAWNAMILDVPKTTVDLLTRLKERYPLYMLSNTNEIHIIKALNEWKRTSDNMPDSFFEKIYLSHEIGMRKTHPSTFEFVCSNMGYQADEVLFIDDSFQHIEGAKLAGLQTIHLANMEQLQEIFS